MKATLFVRRSLREYHHSSNDHILALATETYSCSLFYSTHDDAKAAPHAYIDADLFPERYYHNARELGAY